MFIHLDIQINSVDPKKCTKKKIYTYKINYSVFCLFGFWKALQIVCAASNRKQATKYMNMRERKDRSSKIAVVMGVLLTPLPYI